MTPKFESAEKDTRVMLLYRSLKFFYQNVFQDIYVHKLAFFAIRRTLRDLVNY